MAVRRELLCGWTPSCRDLTYGHFIGVIANEKYAFSYRAVLLSCPCIVLPFFQSWREPRFRIDRHFYEGVLGLLRVVGPCFTRPQLEAFSAIALKERWKDNALLLSLPNLQFSWRLTSETKICTSRPLPCDSKQPEQSS